MSDPVLLQVDLSPVLLKPDSSPVELQQSGSRGAKGVDARQDIVFEIAEPFSSGEPLLEYDVTSDITFDSTISKVRLRYTPTSDWVLSAYKNGTPGQQDGVLWATATVPSGQHVGAWDFVGGPQVTLLADDFAQFFPPDVVDPTAAVVSVALSGPIS